MTDIRLILESDLPLIAEWIKADPWHRDEVRNDPAFLLSGKGLLTFCLFDDDGPLCFTRLDAEGELIRVAVQFGPNISKRRLVVGMVRTFFPTIKNFAVLRKSKGLIYESISPTLIAFCEKQGFVAVGNDDYMWPTGDTTACA